MPTKNSILDLPGFVIQNISGSNPAIVDVEYRPKPRCTYCNSKQLRKKDSFIRKVRHESIGLRQTCLRFKAYKFYCKLCHRYFNQQFPGIQKYQRATERLRKQVFHLHTQGVSQRHLAEDLKLGKATIERWYHYGYQIRHQTFQGRPCPKVLGIDEHFFSKKQGFATTLCDLAKHKVFDIVKGRANKDIGAFLQQLPGRENVRVVCIDLSTTYRNIVRQYFPKAMIVADRFHVIRLVNQSFLKAFQGIDPALKYQRGIVNALRTKPANLSSKQRDNAQLYFNQQPAVEALYDFQQGLLQLLSEKHCKARKCKQLIPELLDKIQQLKHSPLEVLATLGKTLYRWREEIVRMWRFTKNNGITEGFHRKMKLIQRRAYGFRNFENYRLRVKVLCT